MGSTPMVPCPRVPQPDSGLPEYSVTLPQRLLPLPLHLHLLPGPAPASSQVPNGTMQTLSYRNLKNTMEPAMLKMLVLMAASAVSFHFNNNHLL